MSTSLLIVQTLNGLQLGVLLFLIAAGLTLVFGVMDFINLAHGVQYMLGAYLAVMFYAFTGNFFFALVLALGAALVVGNVLALTRPAAKPKEGDLQKAPVARSLVMIGIGLVAAIWAIATLTT